MRRRGNVISPVDSVNSIVEMLIQSDTSVEDGETVWVRSAQTLFVYRVGSGLVPDGRTVFASLYGNPAAVWQRLFVGTGTGNEVPFYARGVGPSTNIANLAAASVGPYDGITYLAGDVILLWGQTTVAQNGPYVVGPVVTGVAALVRPAWWHTGLFIKGGQQIQVGSEGTVFKNTVWQVMFPVPQITVDTSDPGLYPMEVEGTTALTAGTFTISVPIWSAKTHVDLSRITAAGTANTIQYCPTVAGATGITAGLTTGSVVVQATIAAGSINAADTSTLSWKVSNAAL